MDLNDLLLIIIENQIVGCECLADGCSQRVGMHIYLPLVLLSIFTQTWADIMTEGNDVKRELIDRVASCTGVGHTT